MTLPYKNYNANPKGRKTSDCVIRALTMASGKPYETILQELTAISLKTGYFLNDKHNYEKWLESNGFTKMKQPRDVYGYKYTISQIRLLCNASSIVISCAHHLTCVKDGVLIDTWNCGNKTIGNYYVKRG